jgi:predicted phage terminase large subunit-like protein
VARTSQVEREKLIVCPQEGPQMAFVRSSADVAGCGGARGGGKTIGLLEDPLYDVHREDFTAVMFRRTYPEIMQEGGLWDSSRRIKDRTGKHWVPFYPALGGEPRESDMEWRFPSGATIRFAHLQHPWDTNKWLGGQIPWIGFDQLEGFEGKQFWDMFACNRSLCAAHNRIRFSCNPDPDSFLRDLLRWWIDDDSGLAIPERAGVKRWFARMDSGEIIWGDTKAQVVDLCGPESEPLSFAFFPSTVFDNPILLQGDPAYISKLKMLPYVDRLRMLGGNWNVRETAGTMFKREWFQIVDAAPPGVDVRYWDRASTEATGGVEVRGASFTAGARVRKCPDGRFYLMDMARGQWSPLGVEKALSATASQDGRDVTVGIEGDPGQAGVVEAKMQARLLAGYNVKINFVHDPKHVRSKPMRSQVEAGNFLLVRGPWNEAYIRECVDYDGTPATRSDQVDSSSGGFFLLTTAKRVGAWGR